MLTSVGTPLAPQLATCCSVAACAEWRRVFADESSTSLAPARQMGPGLEELETKELAEQLTRNGARGTALAEAGNRTRGIVPPSAQAGDSAAALRAGPLESRKFVLRSLQNLLLSPARRWGSIQWNQLLRLLRVPRPPQ
jgi:hypothetical protein